MKNQYRLVADILARRNDITLMVAEPCDQPMGIELFSDDNRFDKTVFDCCTEPEMQTLLSDFLASRLKNLGFSVQIELSVALCLHGNLVAGQAEKLLLPKIGAGALCPEDYLLWSYFGSDAKYESVCIDLLEKSGEDFRAGIFIACHHLNTPQIYSALVDSFSRWLDLPNWGGGTAESAALELFLDKWDATPGFTCHAKLRAKLMEQEPD